MVDSCNRSAVKFQGCFLKQKYVRVFPERLYPTFCLTRQVDEDCSCVNVDH
jgi:hypothetical protein